MRSRRLIAGVRDVECRPRDCCLQTPAARNQQTPELTRQLLELRFGPGNSDRTRRPRLVEFERQGFRGQWRHIDNGIEQPKLRRHSPLQPGLSGPTGLSSEPSKPQGITRAWATANTLRTNTTHKVNRMRLFGEARNLLGERKKNAERRTRPETTEFKRTTRRYFVGPAGDGRRGANANNCTRPPSTPRTLTTNCGSLCGASGSRHTCHTCKLSHMASISNHAPRRCQENAPRVARSHDLLLHDLSSGIHPAPPPPPMGSQGPGKEI